MINRRNILLRFVDKNGEVDTILTIVKIQKMNKKVRKINI
jgi:hypothetical protein